MEKDTVSLFDTPESDFKIPSETIETSQSLKSDDISDAVIDNAEVKVVVIPEEVNIQVPNYVLDFSEYTDITVFQKEALLNLMSKDGDVALYLYNQKQLIKFGYGLSYRLENIIALTKKYIFSDEIRIYKDVESNKAVSDIKSRDFTKLRLNL